MCKSHGAPTQTTQAWNPDDVINPLVPQGPEIYRPDILEVIEQTISQYDSELRALSLDIHDHPELMFEEHYAHDVMAAFMEKHGFKVTRHFHLGTAWKATFSYGQGGRTLGINSEEDALPGIGHACGHNLIAVSGIAVALAARAALEKFKIPGKIVLLGTPAEEGGAGKAILLEHGAYKEMDICLMCHPSPGPQRSVSLSSSLALQRITVEYSGRTAHAALTPWQGVNALDAAVIAYNNLALLRQQMKPSHRIHGTIQGGEDWAANIIPDKSKMLWYVRAPTRAEVEAAVKRVLPCFEAAALATGCEMKINSTTTPMYDIRQNVALADEVARVVKRKYGTIDYEWGISGASTDFGNVTYELPSLHPGFAIPTVANGGNHTREFAAAARTQAAHEMCMDTSKALAAAGMRLLTDDGFYQEVKKTFEEDKKLREAVV